MIFRQETYTYMCVHTERHWGKEGKREKERKTDR